MVSGKKWSRKHSNCVSCGSAKRKHYAHGLCSRCYLRLYNKDDANRKKAEIYKKQWYQENVARTDKNLKAREARNFGGMRELVLSRDMYQCVRCGSKSQLIVHHKDRSGRGASEHNNKLDNLETLCRACHVDEHRDELVASRKAHDRCKRGHLYSERGRHNGRQWVCLECARIRAEGYRKNRSVGMKPGDSA